MDRLICDEHEKIVSDILETKPYDKWSDFLNSHLKNNPNKVSLYVDYPPDINREDYLKQAIDMQDIYGNNAFRDAVSPPAPNDSKWLEAEYWK